MVLGLASAMLAAMAARVQTDVKSALAFASLTQVGIITAEIGLGLRYMRAGAHHRSCLPANAAVGAGPDAAARLPHRWKTRSATHLPDEPGLPVRWIPERMRLRLYRLSLERGYLDSMINEYVVRPFVWLFRWCDAMERKWTDVACRDASRDVGSASRSAPLRSRSCCDEFRFPWVELAIVLPLVGGRLGSLAARPGLDAPRQPGACAA